jgi:hypothetical protein
MLIHQGFRIEEDIIKALKEHSARKGMTVSSLVNMILKNSVRRDVFFEEVGSIPVPKGILRGLFDSLDKNCLDELGRKTGSAAREYVAYFYHEVNSDTLLLYLDLSFSRFQAYQHKVDRNLHTYSLVHDINSKFSTFYKGFLESLVLSVIGFPPKFNEVTETALLFTINSYKYPMVER